MSVPAKVILIDIENLPAPRTPKHVTALIAQLYKIFPDPQAVFLATAFPLVLEALAQVCHTHDITLLAAPPIKDGADHALLRVAAPWQSLGANFLLVSADGIFSSLRVTDIAHYPNMKIASRLQELSPKFHELHLPGRGQVVLPAPTVVTRTELPEAK